MYNASAANGQKKGCCSRDKTKQRVYGGKMDQTKGVAAATKRIQELVIAHLIF